MKKSLLIAFCCFYMLQTKGQTYAELFRQKKTQQSYLLQQVAGLQVYLGYAAKGYGIIQKGCRAISDIQSGDFQLHDLFFQSLQLVNPILQNPQERKLNRELVQAILLCRLKSMKAIQPSLLLTTAEKEQRTELWAKVIARSEDLSHEDEQLVNQNELKLNDEERLFRLDRIRTALIQLAAVAHSLETNSQALISQRKLSISALEKIKKFYR